MFIDDSENNKTHALDSFEHGDIRLTLVNYQTGYGFSPEIGYRTKSTGDFNLIQWSGISRDKVWTIVKKLVIKNKPIKTIRKILQRLEK